MKKLFLFLTISVAALTSTVNSHAMMRGIRSLKASAKSMHVAMPAMPRFKMRGTSHINHDVMNTKTKKEADKVRAFVGLAKQLESARKDLRYAKSEIAFAATCALGFMMVPYGVEWFDPSALGQTYAHYMSYFTKPGVVASAGLTYLGWHDKVEFQEKVISAQQELEAFVTEQKKHLRVGTEINQKTNI